MASLTDAEEIWRPYVTVATIVPKTSQFLLVEEMVRGELVLNQPAGHLEAGESLLAAAQRETLEETGWEIELECFVGVYQWTNPRQQRDIVRFTFAAQPLRHDPLRALDQGIQRAVWLSYAELLQQQDRLRSPMILKSLDDYLAGQRLPLAAVQALLN